MRHVLAGFGRAALGAAWTAPKWWGLLPDDAKAFVVTVVAMGGFAVGLSCLMAWLEGEPWL